MKKEIITLLLGICMFLPQANAGEKGKISVGTDLASSYVWRGTKFGHGPALQPSIEYSTGIFTLGAWGSYNISDNEAMEADLYMSLDFDFGLSLGMTKYYFPTDPFFSGSSHAFELNSGFSAGAFSLQGNYIMNEGAGSAGGDLYFEAGISTGNLDWFAGGGTGWHTPDGKFGLVNVGVASSKDIKLTDSFSLPVSTAVVLNPTTEQFHVVFTLSL